MLRDDPNGVIQHVLPHHVLQVEPSFMHGVYVLAQVWRGVWTLYGAPHIHGYRHIPHVGYGYRVHLYTQNGCPNTCANTCKPCAPSEYDTVSPEVVQKGDPKGVIYGGSNLGVWTI